MTALGTWFGQGGAMTLSVGGTEHNTNIVGAREVISTTGGQEITTADGVVHRNTQLGTVTGLEVTLVQDLTSGQLWRYLRETTPTTVTVLITGTSSATESASNPEWGYTCSGWVKPVLEFTAGGVATPTAVFTVATAAAVDVT